jgi:hypothetical protein
MAESARQKLANELHEKAKNYKTTHDVERIHHIVAALSLMRDYPQHAAVANSLGKEMTALNAKQAEQDAKDADELQKKTAEAMAADTPHVAEETEASPQRAGRASR